MPAQRKTATSDKVSGGRKVPAKHHGGSKRVPLALKKLKGSVNVTQLARTYDPQLETDISTEPPHWMNDLEQEEYRWAVRCLPPGMLKEADHHMVCAWSKVFARYREASAARDITGQMNCELLMLKMCDKLGFSPTSRSKLPRLANSHPGPTLEAIVVDSWGGSGNVHGADSA